MSVFYLIFSLSLLHADMLITITLYSHSDPRVCPPQLERQKSRSEEQSLTTFSPPRRSKACDMGDGRTMSMYERHYASREAEERMRESVYSSRGYLRSSRPMMLPSRDTFSLSDFFDDIT